MSLRVCVGCERHVRSETCPYCGTTMEVGGASPSGADSFGRIGRAVLALGGVTAFSAAMVACYGGPQPPQRPADAHDVDAPTGQTVAADGGAKTGP
ncbi:MAG: hypothetical protein U0183_34645 [Polyangiaceae bacterium]